MKLISLNIYGGRFYEPLMEFILSHAADTDFFCFQEMLDSQTGRTLSNGARANLLAELTKALPGFTAIFAPAQENFDGSFKVAPAVTSGVAVFVKRSHELKRTGDFFIYREQNSLEPGQPDSLPHNLVFAQLVVSGTVITVCSVHGSAAPIDKLDSAGRLAQSQKILDFVIAQPGEKIISGDFNLLPQTKSITMFEANGFKNLVKDFKIKTTRGSLLKKLHPEYGPSALGWQEFADYALVSPGIMVKSFVVPDLPVSDHLPLILDFEI